MNKEQEMEHFLINYIKTVNTMKRYFEWMQRTQPEVFTKQHFEELQALKTIDHIHKTTL